MNANLQLFTSVWSESISTKQVLGQVNLSPVVKGLRRQKQEIIGTDWGLCYQKGVKQQKSQSTVPTVTELLQLEGICSLLSPSPPFPEAGQPKQAALGHIQSCSVSHQEVSLCHLSQPVPTFDKCHVLVSPELEPALQMCPTMGLRREDGLPPPHLLVGLFLR